MRGCRLLFACGNGGGRCRDRDSRLRDPRGVRRGRWEDEMRCVRSLSLLNSGVGGVDRVDGDGGVLYIVKKVTNASQQYVCIWVVGGGGSPGKRA